RARCALVARRGPDRAPLRWRSERRIPSLSGRGGASQQATTLPTRPGNRRILAMVARRDATPAWGCADRDETVVRGTRVQRRARAACLDATYRVERQRRRLAVAVRL